LIVENAKAPQPQQLTNQVPVDLNLNNEEEITFAEPPLPLQPEEVRIKIPENAPNARFFHPKK
jgi:hypothetical protein